MSILSGVLSIMRTLDIATRICNITKKIGPPCWYPKIAYRNMANPPIAKSQFLNDFAGCFTPLGIGQAAPVTRMSEPMSPVRKI